SNNLRHYCLRLFFSLLFLTVSVTNTVAQGGIDYTGTGGRHTIQGRIFYTSGRRTDVTNLKVVLESTNTGGLSVFADSNGSFAFRNLVGGTYTVVINAGDEYEIVREPIYVDESASRNVRGGMPRTFNVPIYLTPRRSDRSDSKPSVINAALTNVPTAACEAYVHALEV